MQNVQQHFCRLCRVSITLGSMPSSAHQQALSPGPIVGERVFDEHRCQYSPQRDARECKQQDGPLLAPNCVVVKHEGAPEQQHRQEYRKQELWIDVLHTCGVSVHPSYSNSSAHYDQQYTHRIAIHQLTVTNSTPIVQQFLSSL